MSPTKPISVNPESLDPDAVRQAAEHLGLKTMDVPMAQAYSTFGRFLASIGVKMFAHGLCVHNIEQMQEAQAKVLELAKQTGDPEERLQLYALHSKYARQINDAAKTMADIGDVAPQSDNRAPRLPPPAPALTVIVNQQKQVDNPMRRGSVEVAQSV